jgi:hypothetical protein
LLNRRVDRGDIDGQFEHCVAEIWFGADDGDVEFVERAGNFGNAEMSDHKPDSGMRRIGFPSGLRKSGRL